MKGADAGEGILRPDELGPCITVRITLYQGAARNPLTFFKARICHDKIIIFLLGILTMIEK